MSIYLNDGQIQVWHGDCLDVLRELPDESVHAIVTDPPAGIAFMGKDWDGAKGGREQWSAWLADVMRECLRVAKPGAHALVWALPRTAHWTACGLEDAGWEIRDRITHMFGTGFPKSLDVSKAIDRSRSEDREPTEAVRRFLELHRVSRGVSRREVANLFGVDSRMVQKWMGSTPDREAHCPTWDQWTRLRETFGFGEEMDAEVWRLNGRKGTPGDAWDRRHVVGRRADRRADGTVIGLGHSGELNRATSDEARRWNGWGTALKPAAEDWWVARKPFPGTVASNVVQHGTGALNIDACRVPHGDDVDLSATQRSFDAMGYGNRAHDTDAAQTYKPGGRWPANVVLTHGDCGDQCAPGCVVAELDAQSGDGRSVPAIGDRGRRPRGTGETGERNGDPRPNGPTYADAGGASRFFPTFRWEAKAPTSERPTADGAAHPTVKPVDLMRWLVRLVTPPGGTVLDPFLGSGTTAEACVVEGFNCIGIEREADYLPLIRARLGKPIQVGLDIFGDAS